jgi:hypothetical protein
MAGSNSMQGHRNGLHNNFRSFIGRQTDGRDESNKWFSKRVY